MRAVEERVAKQVALAIASQSEAYTLQTKSMAAAHTRELDALRAVHTRDKEELQRRLSVLTARLQTARSTKSPVRYVPCVVVYDT